MNITNSILGLIRRFGYDLQRYDQHTHPGCRLNRLITHYHIGVVLDVGANRGQYAIELRRGGYRGRIISFEPLSNAFRSLQVRASGDPLWTIHNIALSESDSTAQLNVAGNSLSSSLLEMLPAHMEAAPESRYVATERVTTRRLDGLLDELCEPGVPIFLKIDTQGAEQKVLAGAGVALERIDTLQIEMSLVPLYSGQMLLLQMIAMLEKKGYELVGLEPGFSDPRTGRLLQADGIFHRPH